MSNEGKKNIFARFFGAIWRWIKRHKVLSVILVLLIALIIYVVNVVNKAKELLNNNSFDFATVETKDLTNSVSATGKIVGLDKKNAQAGITGVEFTEINVEVGDYVEAGQVIAILDSSDIQENIDIAKKQLNASEANNSIGVNGAARTLNNAEVNRDKDAEKADVNIARAWDAYVNAANAAKEATDKYNNAVNARKSAEEKRNALAGVVGNITNGSANVAQAEFDNTMSDFETFLGGIGIGQGCTGYDVLSYNPTTFINCNKKATEYEPGVDVPDTDPNYGDFLGKGYSDFWPASGSLTSADVDNINGYLTELKRISVDYSQNIASASANLGTADAALASAQSTEAALKSAMDAADSTADSLWNSYNDMIRAKEDTRRMDDSTVATAADSLNTTRNTAAVSNLPSKQNIENLEEQLDKCTVTAPMSGTVTAVNFKKGDKYDGVTPIIVVEDESAYQVSAEIDEYDISKIEIGQAVQIRTNGTGDLELEGKVVSIAPHATTLPASLGSAAASSANVTYNILIDILTPNNDLKMDMTAKIVIITDSKKNCKCIPIDAFQEEEESGRFYVEIYDPTDPTKMSVTEDGKIEYEKLYVEKGMESDYYAEVISNELTEGTQVVIPSEYDNSLYDLTMEFN
ncbi:MAG: HlyD family efflux transporter periplasmic adaptor subunit [Lachnospiraceae bacterium]|jgi:multidrug efflux pump subunit AcrA (membrane-fusion protein)|nr:HlyD family efflux transporter periplasmic adaptor subunit [Lachnospiraceae bacterium]